VSIEKLAMQALARGWSLWQAVERVDAIDGIPTAARDGCHELEKVIGDAHRGLFAHRPASEVARSICDAVRLRADIDATATTPDAAQKRWANVEGILGTLARREAREGTGTDGLAAFLRALTLDLSTEGEEPQDMVTLSTLHGSKGLEFDVVFLVGCEEGYLPHARTLETRATDVVGAEGAADIEEERRLMYVGVTRARERLVLSRARSRVVRGKAVPRTPSRFLLDVPAELLEEVPVTDEAPTTMREAAANAEAILALLSRK
jgi:DNA helicase-2/ATP-dependent DNA helicase PcrA